VYLATGDWNLNVNDPDSGIEMLEADMSDIAGLELVTPPKSSVTFDATMPADDLNSFVASLTATTAAQEAAAGTRRPPAAADGEGLRRRRGNGAGRGSLPARGGAGGPAKGSPDPHPNPKRPHFPATFSEFDEGGAPRETLLTNNGARKDLSGGMGICYDFFFADPDAARRVTATGVDAFRAPPEHRDKFQQASDHLGVWVEVNAA
jgi:hypothetical protein